MAVPGKNSYNVGILCSNWVEDRAGTRLAKVKPALYAAAPFATSSTADAYIDHGPAHTAGPAPAPLDRLDGHLVMAHGPNITSRAPPGDHYLSVQQSFFKRLPEALVLKGPGHVPGNVGRTELIRKKALMRAAGIDAWDISAATKAVSMVLPMTSEPIAAPSLAGVSGAQVSSAAQHFSTVAGRTQSDSAVAALVHAKSGASFGRDGRFTRDFAGSRADYQSLV